MSNVRSLGNHIELDAVGGRTTYTLPAQNYWIFFDEDGDEIPKCQVILARRLPGRAQGLGAHLAHYLRAFTYDRGALPGVLEVPAGPWRQLARVIEIRYRRPGVGPKYHPFRAPVLVDYCEYPEAWRLRLPRGCVVNYRGFVDP